MSLVWTPGQTVVHQEVWAGRIWAARPLIVVEDTEDRLLLWMPKGTQRKVPVTPPTRPDPPARKDRVIENLARCDWMLGEQTWDVSCLWILRPGDWHPVWVSWVQPGVHLGWYVNLQHPFRRTKIGIEAMDMMLDIVVEPDRTWRWKDDDEFEEILERGIFDPSTGERVRNDAEEMIGRIEQWGSPFSEPWTSWQPHPDWSIPHLVEGWDDPER